MNNRSVKLIVPVNSRDYNLISVSKSFVPASKTVKTIYETIVFFENNIFLKDKLNAATKQVKHKIKLKEIVNLHNNTGIKNISQIKDMNLTIKTGKDIFNVNGMPNIKLVNTKSQKLVLFDGHHSLLAYMFSGKTYLHETPHIIVEDEKKGYVEDEEIIVFFGQHKKKIMSKDWRNYVINWQSPKNMQLEKRIQNNMGELYDSIKFFLR